MLRYGRTTAFSDATSRYALVALALERAWVCQKCVTIRRSCREGADRGLPSTAGGSSHPMARSLRDEARTGCGGCRRADGGMGRTERLRKPRDPRRVHRRAGPQPFLTEHVDRHTGSSARFSLRLWRRNE